ncbi:MAG TPA: hypothetical protein VIR54_22695, partial [Vicinamibacterales bacterium]
GVEFVEANWKPPTEANIPNDSLGASNRRGLASVGEPWPIRSLYRRRFVPVPDPPMRCGVMVPAQGTDAR